MVEKYKGNSCKNARIKIDYNGLKPKVNFSYPDKKNQRDYSMLPTIISFWMIILLLVYFGYSFNAGEQELVDLSDYGSCIEYKINKSSTFCKNHEGKTEVDLIILNFKKVNEFLTLRYLILVLMVIAPPFLIYYPFKEQWTNIFPKYQAKMGECKFIKFKSKDVRKEKDYYFVEIPLFSNVMLEYDAKKDFSKYLKYFEIREYNFKYVQGATIKKAMKSKKEVNENIWYAKFYFSEKPIEGELVVLFK